MPHIPAKQLFLKLGGGVPSYIEIEKGKIEISVPVIFLGNSYDIALATLETGEIQGLEFLFSPNKEVGYQLTALESSEVNVAKETLMTLYKRNPSEIFSLTKRYLPSLGRILKTYSIIDNAYTTTHRIFYSFISALGYVSSKYNFSIEDGEIFSLIEDVNRYIEKYRLSSKVFPLGNELYKIPFHEFNSYDSGTDIINPLYLKKIVANIDSMQKVFGNDSILTLDFIMDISFKTASLIELTKYKMQSMLERIEILYSLDMQNVVRNLFQNAVRSEEISKYLSSVSKSTLIFLDQKTLVGLESLNQPLFLALKDNLDKARAFIGRLEESSLSSKTQQVDNKTPIPKELTNTLGQILDFAEYEGEERKNILEEYNQWKISPNRMAIDDTIGKLRKRVSESFWKLYTACFKKHKIGGKPLSKAIELFFYYGLWDETLLAGNILNTLIKKIKPSPTASEPHVYSVYEWLISVCDEKYSISNNRDGEYPDTVFKNMGKEEEQKTGKKIDPKTLNTLEFRIEYEINNFVKESSKICNGVFSQYIPILLQEQFTMVDLDQQVLTVEKVQKAFLELRELDFSAFYREVRYRDDSANINEFVQKEILPVFILMPGVGMKSIVWQPKERSKETSARIALPAISFTPPEQIMLDAFGFFRWEMVKEVLGPAWNDISLVSITSEYSDYESSYKNNKLLDDEIKERIAQDFKKYRNTRDRFIHDYKRWITVDSQGRPGVNKVLRELFYRQIPFPKAIRARLGNTPAYEQLNDRYMILVRREIGKLKLKYQKYQKEDGILPPDLESYIQFLAR